MTEARRERVDTTVTGPATRIAALGSVFLIVLSGVIGVLVMSVLVGAAEARAQATPGPSQRLLVVGFDRDLPPYSFLDEGRPAGFTIDLLAEIARVLDVELDLRPMTHSESLAALATGEIDLIANLAPTEELESRFALTLPHSPDHPLLADVIFVRGEGSGILSLEDLAGKDVIVRRDDPAREYFSRLARGIRLHVEDSFPDALRRLAAGEGDAAILPEAPGEALVEKLNLEGLRITGPPLDAYRRDLSFAVRQNRPELLQELERALTIVTANRAYSELYNTWMRSPDQRVEEILWRIFLWVVLPLLALIAFLIIVSWGLRRMVARRTAELEAARLVLKSSEEKYRGLFDSSRDAIALCDLEGRWLDANPACLGMFGLDLVDFKQRRRQDLTVEEWREEEERILGTLVEQRLLAREYEKECRRASGEAFPVSVRAWLMLDELGEPAGFWCILRDLTEQKAAAEEKKRLEEKIQQTQKLESLGVLAGGIAHDFNNILMGIMGNAGLALMELPKKDPLTSRMRDIEAASQRAARLCQQMLAYSGKGRMALTDIDLSALIDEMASLIEASISKKVVLEKRLAADLPRFKGDPDQIRQVVLNLVTNASEAIGDAPGSLSVETGVAECGREYLRRTYLTDEFEPGAYVYLEVTDDGAGMDEATQERMFDPFFSTKFTGRGLGLAATLGIVRGHHGTLEVESEPRSGTRFRVLFPGTDASSDGLARPPVAALQRLAPAPPNGRTVLVIDDEELVASVAQRALEIAGFQVLTAGDGVVGVEVFRQRSDEIAAVLLDMTMPEMSGEETLRRLREVRPDAAIILSSGYSENALGRRFAAEPAIRFLQKPYSPEALVEKVQLLIEENPSDERRET